MDELVTCEAWKLQKKASAEEGLIATAYERKHGEWRYDAIGLLFLCFAQLKILTHCWWLVRVTLVVGLVFMPQNFGPVVGNYECHLPFSERTWCRTV